VGSSHNQGSCQRTSFAELDQAEDQLPISCVPLEEPITPHLDELLGPASSTEDVLKSLDDQYRKEGRLPVWFLPLDEPISPHLDELPGPVGGADS